VDLLSQIRAGKQLRAADSMEEPPTPGRDVRGQPRDFLSEIRGGARTLRRVTGGTMTMGGGESRRTNTGTMVEALSQAMDKRREMLANMADGGQDSEEDSGSDSDWED
jgi:hypothetical protein